MNNTIDLIVAWPRHMDYPLWRKQIVKNRGLFESVNVVFTYMNVDKDYREFVRESMRTHNITFMNNDTVTGADDWRNVAVNKALGICKSDWIFFTEQDFYWTDDFWPTVKKQMDNVDYIRAMVDVRVHPCCILLKRKVLNQTRQDFGVIRDVSDHFSKLQQDLENLQTPYYNIPQELWYHMSGLSQDMWMLMNNQIPTSPKEQVLQYVQDCLKPGIVNHPDFESLYRKYLNENI